ncbi:MAG: NUDIX domain-containing protein [Eubacteriales bacterium]|nr:NUDIX domain-containing protein [Eubacteriales bacterium]
MELWDLYTFDRRKTGETMTRGQRQPEGRFRQTVHVCLFNKAGEMLIQRRQPFMKGWPGLWDFTAGGSALAGKSSQEAAGRELLEELGVDISFAGIRPALSLPFGKGFDDIFTREQELELAALRLQPEEVEAVQWAGEAKVLAMLEEGTFVPYHPGLVMLLFSLRNTRSSHTRPDPTRRNRRDP